MNDDLAIDTYARLRSITGNGELSILLLLAGAVAIAVALHAVAMFVLRRLIFLMALQVKLAPEKPRPG